MSNKIVRNERIKLTANFINALASGSVLVGLVTPLAGVALGTFAVRDAWNLVGFGLFGLVWALVLHSFARRILADLED
ncbi:hypothetical protein NO932_12430 [Pelagibacterium sp. 26DY04]|uniref:hypothetical protein n=1 Tax=unclassified Pelagibacterium TaxID=2623280 RepID=UPI002815F361|nr:MULTISPECIES: hypothetical protein [unclassified Pelagibacterium]WMT85732.1 hypothetical protein NO932_12430 [Pelagibacterium sp. 26DY04]WMT89983.1 hypothetical protein NO934_14455 [Pelagibacterium sp. H642]